MRIRITLKRKTRLKLSIILWRKRVKITWLSKNVINTSRVEMKWNSVLNDKGLNGKEREADFRVILTLWGSKNQITPIALRIERITCPSLHVKMINWTNSSSNSYKTTTCINFLRTYFARWCDLKAKRTWALKITQK